MKLSLAAQTLFLASLVSAAPVAFEFPEPDLFPSISLDLPDIIPTSVVDEIKSKVESIVSDINHLSIPEPSAIEEKFSSVFSEAEEHITSLLIPLPSEVGSEASRLLASVTQHLSLPTSIDIPAISSAPKIEKRLAIPAQTADVAPVATNAASFVTVANQYVSLSEIADQVTITSPLTTFGAVQTGVVEKREDVDGYVSTAEEIISDAEKLVSVAERIITMVHLPTEFEKHLHLPSESKLEQDLATVIKIEEQIGTVIEVAEDIYTIVKIIEQVATVVAAL